MPAKPAARVRDDERFAADADHEVEGLLQRAANLLHRRRGRAAPARKQHVRARLSKACKRLIGVVEVRGCRAGSSRCARSSVETGKDAFARRFPPRRRRARTE